MSQSSTLPFNFGGIDDDALSSRESARVLVLPVAYEGTVSYGAGTAQGAQGIIDASRNMELYDEETDTEIYRLGIHTLPAIESAGTPEAMMQSVYEGVRELLALDNKFIVTIGGEHSITAPVVRAHKERYENLSALQIDAHADLRETYDDTPYSHACVMRRITDDMKIPAVQCGIRSLSADEARAIKDLPTHIYWAKDLVGRDGWQEAAISHLTENVFLTIDVDGFDSSIMPHTGTPEPGGFAWYEVTKLIHTLAANRRIVGFDIVEYAHTEGSHASAFLCAKLIYKTLSFIFADETVRVRGA
ncbi:MAG: agmatinase [Pyrinomonadaceae bacterium MAG19_C2-C3]|nr:agmatinase [Pyrinomonadaceae bacterium MAG19_C2-C3]